MNQFIFNSYVFDKDSLTARFQYEFDNGHTFMETIIFGKAGYYDEKILDRALFLAFVLIGTSYYKTFPTSEVVLKNHTLDEWQVNFFNVVYQEGLSQFAFENDLTRDQLAHFISSADQTSEAENYAGSGILALQSGGKD